MFLESQRLRTPTASDTATDTDSSDNGRCFLMPSTGTHPTVLGTDLCMVVGETAAGKTAVPATQNRLTVAGDVQDDKVTTSFPNVRAKKNVTDNILT
jgi:hypothetical protein